MLPACARRPARWAAIGAATAASGRRSGL